MYHQIIVIITININILLRYITTLNISLGTNTYFFFFNQYTSIRDYIWTVDLHFRIGELRYTTDTFLSNIGKEKRTEWCRIFLRYISINFSSVSSPSSFLFPFTLDRSRFFGSVKLLKEQQGLQNFTFFRGLGKKSYFL